MELPSLDNYDSDVLNSPQHIDMEMKMRELHSSSPIGKSSIITFTPNSQYKANQSSVGLRLKPRNM